MYTRNLGFYAIANNCRDAHLETIWLIADLLSVNQETLGARSRLIYKPKVSLGSELKLVQSVFTTCVDPRVTMSVSGRGCVESPAPNL